MPDHTVKCKKTTCFMQSHPSLCFLNIHVLLIYPNTSLTVTVMGSKMDKLTSAISAVKMVPIEFKGESLKCIPHN